jgi:hypothetical protein
VLVPPVPAPPVPPPPPVPPEQVPDEHVPPAGHWWPQLPQLDESVVVSTHPEPHGVCPVGQAHALPWQDWPDGHTVPQAPQFWTLDCRSTQLEPHGTRPGPQLVAQLPLEHSVPAAHALVHVPQCAPSACRSTQLEPHSVGPGAQGLPPPVAGIPPVPPDSPELPPAPQLQTAQQSDRNNPARMDRLRVPRRRTLLFLSRELTAFGLDFGRNRRAGRPTACSA